MNLLEPLRLGPRSARNRVVFGPHETNLADHRRLSARHVAYYRRRAAGGAGVVVVEEASVHPSDWPYERAPLAAECEPGWADIASACQAEGALVIAALGHAGGQGSSAYSQAPLWAPSRVPEVGSREVPKWMEAGDISAVVDGFAQATRLAVAAGCDGVEVNAGQHSLVRQFLSGLTNQRPDGWGTDKLLFARQVLDAVRAAAGPGAVVGLRLSCDELAPWAGLTPEMAVDVATQLAPLVDYLTVVRGSIFSVGATRPDGHTPPGFNLDLAGQVRAAVPPEVAVIAQGSIVDWGQAEWAVAEGRCDAVEMTRAQLADARIVRKLESGDVDRIRPCILCNQTCMARDARNPIVTCVVDPRTGHELTDADPETETDTGEPAVRDHPSEVLVVGGGVAGLEVARVAALRGHRVTVAERADRTGGMARTAAAGAGRERLALVVDWLSAECDRLGVKVETGRQVTAAELAVGGGTVGGGSAVVLCTGSVPGPRSYDVADGTTVLTAAEALEAWPGPALATPPEARVDDTDAAGPGAAAVPDGVPAGRVLVWDPIGGPIGISVVEALRSAGRDVALATPDLIAGNELARSGDLAPANVRLQASGVDIERRSILRSVQPGGAVLEDRFTGERRTVDADVVVDAGHRLPDDALWHETGGRLPRAGDAVAPRTIHEAILEGRRRALELR